jgi:hypothetical protein
VLAKIFNEFPEIAQCPKKAVKQHQRLAVAFFNVFELSVLFNFVIHQQSVLISQLNAKVIFSGQILNERVKKIMLPGFT